MKEEISKIFCEQIAEKYSKHKLERPVYVIKEHRATRVQWDQRSEINDKLKSWALTKGVPKGNDKEEK